MAKAKQTEEGVDDTQTHKVRRELTPDELDEKKERFVEASIEQMDIGEKRTIYCQKANIRIKDLRNELYELAQVIRDKAEWIDAQMTLEEANKARKARVRSVQPPAP